MEYNTYLNSRINRYVLLLILCKFMFINEECIYPLAPDNSVQFQGSILHCLNIQKRKYLSKVKKKIQIFFDYDKFLAFKKEE